jgi:ABC-type transport system substrate-binding protein
MRQVLALFTALVFTSSLAGVALAQGTSSPSGSSTTSPSSSATDDTTKSTAPSGSATTGTDPTTGAAGTTSKDKMGAGKTGAGKTAAGSMRGQHKMTGEVTKVDQSKGMLTLKTDEGDVDLHFPPSALQGVKEGDRVEVQMAIRPAGAGAAKSGASQNSGAPAKSGAQSGAQQKTQ